MAGRCQERLHRQAGAAPCRACPEGGAPTHRQLTACLNVWLVACTLQHFMWQVDISGVHILSWVAPDKLETPGRCPVRASPQT